MRTRKSWLQVRLFAVCALLSVALKADDASKPSFDQLIGSGRQSLNTGKLSDALVTAMAAVNEEPDRFEGYALAALVFQKRGDVADAVEFVDKALVKAPAEKKPMLEQLKSSFGSTAPSLVGSAQRQYDALLLLIENADSADSVDIRRQDLSEFLKKSSRLLNERPDLVNLWMLRAMAALELDRPIEGSEAAEMLLKLNADKSDDAKSRRIMASLELKGWFAVGLHQQLIDDEERKKKDAAEALQKQAEEESREKAAVAERVRLREEEDQRQKAKQVEDEAMAKQIQLKRQPLERLYVGVWRAVGVKRRERGYDPDSFNSLGAISIELDDHFVLHANGIVSITYKGLAMGDAATIKIRIRINDTIDLSAEDTIASEKAYFHGSENDATTWDEDAYTHGGDVKIHSADEVFIRNHDDSATVMFGPERFEIGGILFER